MGRHRRKGGDLLAAIYNSQLNAFQKVSDASGFKRAAEECRIRWVGDRHPKINHGDWSSEETDHLSRLIISATETSDKVNWVNVAKQLGVSGLSLMGYLSLIFFLDQPYPPRVYETWCSPTTIFLVIRSRPNAAHCHRIVRK